MSRRKPARSGFGRRLRGLALAGILAAAGCASAPPEQDKHTAEIRAFADAIADTYRVSRIPVLVGTSVSNEGGHYTRGLFTISTSMLGSPHRDKVVAHELAHYLLGHEYPVLRREEQHQRELDANAKTVEIFARVKGWSEEQAIRAVYGHLLASWRSVERGMPVPVGHLPPCLEIADLLGRFPRHAAWTGALECAPATIAARAALPARIKTYDAPMPVGGSSDRLLYAYFVDHPIPRGAAFGPGREGNLPRARREFYVDGDRSLLLLLVLQNVKPGARLRSRWLDPQGVERRTSNQVLTFTTTPGQWAWATHGNNLSDVWLYPGRWSVSVSVDEHELGPYSFELVPGAGQ